MPEFHIMVGLPGSGKSQTAKTIAGADAVIISSDSIIDEIAELYNTTYDDIQQDMRFFGVTGIMFHRLKSAMAQGKSIVIDRTNMGSKSRYMWFRAIMASETTYDVKFHVIALPTTESEFAILRSRLDSRPGKTIADDVIERFISEFEMPFIGNLVSEITVYDMFGNVIETPILELT